MFGAKRSPCLAGAAPQPVNRDLSITAPTNGATIGTLEADGTAREDVRGAATIAAGEALWIFLLATDICAYYIENRAPIEVEMGHWHLRAGLDYSEKGSYILYAVVVGDTDNEHIVSGIKTTDDPWVFQLPPGRSAHVAVRCCK
jgi:hypothetical protein